MLFHFVLLLAMRIEPAAADVPYKQPQLAAGHGQVVMAFGAGKSIYFTASSDNGQTFGKPVTVAEAGAIALGRHRGPRVVILKDALVISAIVGDKVATGTHAHGLPEAGSLTVWRSTDKGKTWARTGVVNDVAGAAREGLHSMTADDKGNLFAAWLDLREKGTRLVGARSMDGGKTWSKNALVHASPEGTICQCCAPTVAADHDGKIWAMWRNVLDGNRDMYVANSADGATFGAAKKLGAGSWKLNACPMDGGGFAVENGKVTSAWRRDGEVFLTGPDNQEQRIGAGKDVALAVSKSGAYVAWTKETALQLHKPGQAEAELLAPEGAFVNLVALPDGSVLAAWESKGAIETRQLR